LLVYDIQKRVYYRRCLYGYLRRRATTMSLWHTIVNSCSPLTLGRISPKLTQNFKTQVMKSRHSKARWWSPAPGYDEDEFVIPVEHSSI